MSPIIDIQRSLAEVGRIRMGHQVAAKKRSGEDTTRPALLDHWRFTTPDRARADQIAELYGGEVKPWSEREGFWEIYSTSSELPIALMPGYSVTQWYELWSGGGCKRRCDGETEMLSDTPCLCDPDDRECDPHTRLNVLLPEVKGLGHWLLTTSGWNAAKELPGIIEALQSISVAGEIVQARIRIDKRTEIKDGQTRHFNVPVLDVDVSLNDLLQRQYVPLDASVARGVSLGEGLRVIEQGSGPTTARGAAVAPLGPVTPPPDVPAPFGGDDGPTGEGVSPPAPSPSAATVKVVTKAQVTRLWTMIRKRGDVSDERVKAIVLEVTGQESTREIPKDLYDAVYATIQAEPKGDPVDAS